jgi:hypothetical protein
MLEYISFVAHVFLHSEVFLCPLQQGNRSEIRRTSRGAAGERPAGRGTRRTCKTATPSGLPRAPQLSVRPEALPRRRINFRHHHLRPHPRRPIRQLHPRPPRQPHRPHDRPAPTVARTALLTVRELSRRLR